MNRLLRTSLLIALSVGAVLCSCSGSKDPFDDINVPANANNPDGTPYPTDDWGGRAHDGSVPGNRIPNFSFRGYPSSRVDAGLKVVSLADYYDPSQTRHKLLLLTAVVAWCPHCAATTNAIVRSLPDLEKEGAVCLQALMEGPDLGDPMTLGDLGKWVQDHSTRFTVVFDVGGRRLGTIADLSAVPWIALIDTRSMEILAKGTGAPDDMTSYVRQGLGWVDQNPPRP